MNQRFGAPEPGSTARPEAAAGSAALLPRSAGDAYTFCGHCGKRLPDVQEEDHP